MIHHFNFAIYLFLALGVAGSYPLPLNYHHHAVCTQKIEFSPYLLRSQEDRIYMRPKVRTLIISWILIALVVGVIKNGTRSGAKRVHVKN